MNWENFSDDFSFLFHPTFSMKILKPFLIVCIILLSFFLYSYNYCPALNSDGAVNVLMTYYFKLPRDLYYWGQDRWGSFIPLVAQFFFKICHLSPLTSISISNYIILIAGYFCFSILLKTNFTKIIFAIIWFLPPLRFSDMLWYATGIQYSLIAISIFLMTKLKYNDDEKNRFKNHLIFAFIILLFISSVWVSDASLATIFILISITFLFDWKKIKSKKIWASYLFIGSILGCVFIHYAKNHVMASTEGYLKPNDIKAFVESIAIIKSSLLDLLLFRKPEFFMSMYCYLAIAFILLLAYILIKKSVAIDSSQKKWLYFFLADGIIVIAVALLSRWVFVNGVNRRYFFGSYISLSIALLIIIESLKIEKRVLTGIRTSLVAIVLIGAISTPYYMKTVWPKTLRPQADVFSEFKSLGKIGVIANYWKSYIAACPDPSQVVATPYDKDNVRNPELVDEVFKQPSLYIIKDYWMNTFPDTLLQFGRTLVKEGEVIKVGGCEVSKYKESSRVIK